MFKIAILVSGGGSNLQAIIDSVKSGYLKCEIEVVISDREGTYGIERARNCGIDTMVVDRKVYKEKLSEEILKRIEGKVDLIVLSGFLSILRGDIVEKFKGKIINIHPSLIPSFCGDGMYGINVHKRALEYGVKLSGCSVHFADAGTDTGPIILQRAVPVLDNDTPESLQQRILIEEHRALVEAVKLISEGKVKIEGRRVMEV